MTTLPYATTSQIQFGHVRSARSVFASSTPVCGNSLILFDFSTIGATITTPGSVYSSVLEKHEHQPVKTRYTSSAYAPSKPGCPVLLIRRSLVRAQVEEPYKPYQA